MACEHGCAHMPGLLLGWVWSWLKLLAARQEGDQTPQAKGVPLNKTLMPHRGRCYLNYQQ